ncbi:MAG: GNAT family N-acetyltransferase [bacterium]|nr:GNAT family N-acetyltransferase [bacterium]
MTIGYRKPRLLRPDDSLDEFECRSPEQTLWLRDHARQADASGTAKVMIVTEAGSQTVVAYYAWAMANISVDDAPDRVRKGAGRYPQPIALLARLGVDIDHEGNGLGAGLLQDVISRVAEFGTQIGCRGLLVHAENEDARDFYLHLLPGFESSPTDPLHLVLLMKDIHHALKG